MTTTTLHVTQCSLRFTATRDQNAGAIAEVLKRHPDTVGFTEAAEGDLRPTVREVCDRFNYHIYGGGGDTMVAVSPGHIVLAHGSQFVHHGKRGPASKGGHGPRYIDWVTFGLNGSEVSFHEAHWVTRHPDTTQRRIEHAALTDAMCDAVQRRGVGRRLAFFGGDTNVDEAHDLGELPRLPHWQFARAGLRTIYDELHEYPDTHGNSTIDVIGSYDEDRRVRGARLHVWPHHDGLDHAAVSAWYDVEDRRHPV